MRKIIYNSFIVLFCIVTNNILAQPIIADHNCTDLSQISEQEIIDAKNILHIAYGHTSHGSQIITGMDGLDDFMGGTGLYIWNDGLMNGYLDIDDRFVGGDLGNPDRVTWASRTQEYLNNSANSDVNVVIWSWCGQVSSASESDINTYLNLMNDLEDDYPHVKFVYMTGHLDGDGLTGNLHLRNEQIRDYCKNNNKILYDFADIECYDPDGTYFGDRHPNDDCDYDTDGNSSLDGNWAIEWQSSHTEGEDWYSCGCAHSRAVNCNQKAYAAWWLWAKLADTLSTNSDDHTQPIGFVLHQNYPNPFNPTTTINYSLQVSDNVELTIYNQLGEFITIIVNEYQHSGEYKIDFNTKELPSGTYFYRLKTGNNHIIKKMILIK